MTETEHGDSRTDLNGLSVEQAVDIVVDDKDDSGTVRETLAIVSQDGSSAERVSTTHLPTRQKW